MTGPGSPPLAWTELERLVAAGDVDTVIVAFTDMQGRLAGKRISGRHFVDDIATRGVECCSYLLAVDVDLNTVPGYAMASWDTGYGDMVMTPDLSTLRLIPWLPGTALVIADLVWADGSEVAVSPRQQLKADDAGVVEGNDDGLRYPLGVPEGFDEIRALEGRVRVIPGFVGVAVADVVQVDAGEVESRAQESFHLRPTVGTIRPARQERSRDPRPSSAPYERAQRRTWVDARPLSVVAHPLPSGEPLLCADERARPVRHRALASRWRRLSRSMSVHLRNQSTPISLRVALTDVQCRL